MNEASLAVRTPKGLAVVVGCSHPGVEKILEEAARIDPQLYMVTGGFHLVMAPHEEVQRTADTLIDTLKVQRVALRIAPVNKGSPHFSIGTRTVSIKQVWAQGLPYRSGCPPPPSPSLRHSLWLLWVCLRCASVVQAWPITAERRPSVYRTLRRRGTPRRLV